MKYGWTYGVMKPLLTANPANRTMMMTLLTDYSGAALGVLAAAFFRAKVLLRQQDPQA